MPFRGGQAGTPGSKFSRGGPARKGPTPAAGRSMGAAKRSANSMGKMPGTRGGKVPMKGGRGSFGPLQPGRPVTNPLVRPGGSSGTRRRAPGGGGSYSGAPLKRTLGSMQQARRSAPRGY